MAPDWYSPQGVTSAVFHYNTTRYNTISDHNNDERMRQTIPCTHKNHSTVRPYECVGCELKPDTYYFFVAV